MSALLFARRLRTKASTRLSQRFFYLVVFEKNNFFLIKLVIGDFRAFYL